MARLGREIEVSAPTGARSSCATRASGTRAASRDLLDAVAAEPQVTLVLQPGQAIGRATGAGASSTRCARRAALFLVAESAGAVAGNLGLWPDANPRLRPRGVDRHVGGRRLSAALGVGGALLETALEWAAAAGFRRGRRSACSRRTPGRCAFYERHGFVREGLAACAVPPRRTAIMTRCSWLVPSAAGASLAMHRRAALIVLVTAGVIVARLRRRPWSSFGLGWLQLPHIQPWGRAGGQGHDVARGLDAVRRRSTWSGCSASSVLLVWSFDRIGHTVAPRSRARRRRGRRRTLRARRRARRPCQAMNAEASRATSPTAAPPRASAEREPAQRRRDAATAHDARHGGDEGASPGAHRPGQHRAGGRGGRHGRGRRPVHRPQEGRRQLQRALPVPRGEHAVVLGQPGGEALLLLRLRRRRQPLRVRHGQGEPGLRRGRRVPRRQVRHRARVRGVERSRRRRPPAAASACGRCSSRPPPTTSACCREAKAARAGPRVPRGARPRATRSAAHFRVGFCLPGWEQAARRRRSPRASTSRSCSTPAS